jgi:hypothetical protein
LDWLQERWNNLRDCFRKGNKNRVEHGDSVQ